MEKCQTKIRGVDSHCTSAHSSGTDSEHYSWILRLILWALLMNENGWYMCEDMRCAYRYERNSSLYHEQQGTKAEPWNQRSRQSRQVHRSAIPGFHPEMPHVSNWFEILCLMTSSTVYKSTSKFFWPGNGSPSVTNVVVMLLLIRFSKVLRLCRFWIDRYETFHTYQRQHSASSYRGGILT